MELGWWGDEMQITVNRNVVCEPHVDTNNSEYSYITFLGDFRGGALVFEDGQRLEEPCKWHKIRANELRRWSEPILEGVKYSVILYRKRSRDSDGRTASPSACPTPIENWSSSSLRCPAQIASWTLSRTLGSATTSSISPVGSGFSVSFI